MTYNYLLSKVNKKLKGANIINTTNYNTSKVVSGSHIFDSIMDKHSFFGFDSGVVNAEIVSF